MPALPDLRLGSRTRSLPAGQLGWLERWYAAQPIARVAGCVLEFADPVAEGTLRRALGTLQARHHEALSVTLRATRRGPVFARLEDAPLPLSSSAQGDAWALAEASLLAPFPESGPLWRLVRTGDGRSLAASFHHVVADGMSVAVFARELLAVLRGEALPHVSEPRRPLDVCLDLRPPLRLLLGEVLARRTPPFYAGPAHVHVGLRTSLLPWQLSAPQLATLVERARREQATVHGALCAAGLVASAVIQGGLPLPARLLTPVSLRHLAKPPPSGFGVHLCGVESDHALHAQLPFWQFAAHYARLVHRSLPGAYQRLGLLRFAGDLGQRAQELLDTKPNGRTATLEVSNLGRLAGTADAKLWFIQGNHYHGPLFNLSVATCAARGVLRGTLATPAPVVDQASAKSFVNALEQTLAQACEGEPTFGMLVAANL